MLRLSHENILTTNVSQIALVQVQGVYTCTVHIYMYIYSGWKHNGLESCIGTCTSSVLIMV